MFCSVFVFSLLQAELGDIGEDLGIAPATAQEVPDITSNFNDGEVRVENVTGVERAEHTLHDHSHLQADLFSAGASPDVNPFLLDSGLAAGSDLQVVVWM